MCIVAFLDSSLLLQSMSWRNPITSLYCFDKEKYSHHLMFINSSEYTGASV